MWYLIIQLIVIICKLCICKFSYLVNFISNPERNNYDVFVAHREHSQYGEKAEEPKEHTPEVQHREALSSCFSSPTVNEYPFWGLLSPTLFVFFESDFTV